MEIINIKDLKQNLFFNKDEKKRNLCIRGVAGLMCELWNDNDVEGYMNEIEERLKYNYTILVAIEEEKVVGYIELTEMYSYDEKSVPPVLNICGLFITENMRQKGIATKLIECAESYGRSQGNERISSSYYDFNSHSAFLHKKLGFQETSRIINVIKNL